MTDQSLLRLSMLVFLLAASLTLLVLAFMPLPQVMGALSPVLVTSLVVAGLCGSFTSLVLALWRWRSMALLMFGVLLVLLATLLGLWGSEPQQYLVGKGDRLPVGEDRLVCRDIERAHGEVIGGTFQMHSREMEPEEAKALLNAPAYLAGLRLTVLGEQRLPSGGQGVLLQVDQPRGWGLLCLGMFACVLGASWYACRRLTQLCASARR